MLTDCQFNYRDIDVHYLEGGSGFPLLMVHGSGPGASTLGNWRKVLEPLASRYHVFAMDLVGFGQSGRKAGAPFFDFPLWLDQCMAMLARMPEGPVGLLGHSIAGSLALKAAARCERVSKVMTTGCMGAVFVPNRATETTWTFPADRAALVEAAANLIHDRSLIDEAYLANREAVLRSGDYDSYFGSMFGGDKRRFIDAAVLSTEELARVKCEVLMLHGRQDIGFPAELSLRVAEHLPHADVVLLGNCSHSIAFEHPDKFLSFANSFMG